MLTTLEQVSTLDALTTRVLLDAEYFLRIVEQHQWVIVSIGPEPMHQDTHAPRRACSICRPKRLSTPVEDSANGRRKRLPPGLVGYHRRRLPGVSEPDAIEVRNIRSTSAPLSLTLSMTADHHGQRATPFVLASKTTILDALGAKTSIIIFRSAEGTATTRPCPRRSRGKRRPGSAASATGPTTSSPGARPRIWRRSGRWNTRCTTRHRGTADSQLSRPHRPVYPSARFRPPAPVGPGH